MLVSWEETEAFGLSAVLGPRVDGWWYTFLSAPAFDGECTPMLTPR